MRASRAARVARPGSPRRVLRVRTMNRAGGAYVRMACEVNFCIQLARFGLDHSNQLAGLPHQRGDHPLCLDRLGRVKPML
jgi:hypothetical protein